MAHEGIGVEPGPFDQALQAATRNPPEVQRFLGFSSTLGPHVKLDLDSDVPLPAGQACGLAPDECEACQ